MPPRSRIGALRIALPKQWRLEVRRALREAKGNLDVAAAALAVSRRQLSRWIECADRAQAVSSQTARCGKCAGCLVVKGLPLGEPGRPWPAEEEAP